MKRLVCSVPQAGRLLQLSRDSAYEAAKRGDIPTLKIGRRKVVPLSALEGMLGLEPGTLGSADFDEIAK